MQLHPTYSVPTMPMTLSENKSLFLACTQQEPGRDPGCLWHEEHFAGFYTPPKRRLQNIGAHHKEFSKGQHSASMWFCRDPIQASSVIKKPEKAVSPGREPQGESPLPPEQRSSVNGTSPVQLLTPSAIEEPLDTGRSERTQQVNGKPCAPPHEHSGLVQVTAVATYPWGTFSCICHPSLPPVSMSVTPQERIHLERKLVPFWASVANGPGRTLGVPWPGGPRDLHPTNGFPLQKGTKARLPSGESQVAGTSLMSSPAFFALSICGELSASHPAPFMPIRSDL